MVLYATSYEEKGWKDKGEKDVPVKRFQSSSRL